MRWSPEARPGSPNVICHISRAVEASECAQRSPRHSAVYTSLVIFQSREPSQPIVLSAMAFLHPLAPSHSHPSDGRSSVVFQTCLSASASSAPLLCHSAAALLGWVLALEGGRETSMPQLMERGGERQRRGTERQRDKGDSGSWPCCRGSAGKAPSDKPLTAGRPQPRGPGPSAYISLKAGYRSTPPRCLRSSLIDLLL
ncbi:hypothetical protein SKAU_G00134970 [Synaphobranchus kaupii]|uniref:Uncharacterized protein n=1 Tax=Synaphobranchus kaupii TaxID=118154 RepID=A0A9Q1FRR8_SYNKA|nr:hypothetical protein SKAU_G00134970 [Synaphobranchus kaupii]